LPAMARSLWALAAGAFLFTACVDELPPSEHEAGDPLWVAAVERSSGWRNSEVAVLPIGSLENGEWEQPWPEPLAFGRLASLDSIGRLTVDHSVFPPTDISASGRLRIDAPLEWYVYPDVTMRDTLSIMGIGWEFAYCGRKWTLFAPPVAYEAFQGGTSRWLGAAFSQPVKIVSSADEILRLNSIGAAMGLIGNDDYRVGFCEVHWLGYFDLAHGGVVGIVSDRDRDGHRYLIVSFQGDQGKIVREFRDPRC